MVKAAQKLFLGGHSEYVMDLDGHYWEVAHADFWQFKEDGSIVVSYSQLLAVIGILLDSKKEAEASLMLATSSSF